MAFLQQHRNTDLISELKVSDFANTGIYNNKTICATLVVFGNEGSFSSSLSKENSHEFKTTENMFLLSMIVQIIRSSYSGERHLESSTKRILTLFCPVYCTQWHYIFYLTNGGIGF